MRVCAESDGMVAISDRELTKEEYELSNISKGTQVKATCTHYAIKDGITARKYSSIDQFTAQ